MLKKCCLKKIHKCIFNNSSIICLSNLLTRDVYDDIPFIVPKGIELQPEFGDPRINSDGSTPLILYLFNYLLTKGVLILIDALDILNIQGYQFSAGIVGAPADLSVSDLEKKIFNQGLHDHIKVLGPLYGKDKFYELHEADIFVFPTYNDVF